MNSVPVPFDCADDDPVYEVVDGVRVELPPMRVCDSCLATELFLRLAPAVWERGWPSVQMLFLLDPAADLQRRPDVSFVSEERWRADVPLPSTNYWGVVPELAVEVVGPANGAVEILTKVHDYFRCGVRLV